MQISHKFRLYPSKQQEGELLQTFDKCRFVYNQMLEGLNKQEKPNRLELQSSIPKLKEKHPELNGVYSKVLQYEVYRLFSNLKALGRLKKNGKKVGKLRFKGRDWFKTITYNQSGFKIILTGKRCQTLHLSKIGEIRVRMHRNIKGKIKQATIKKCKSGKWFAIFAVEMTIKQKENKLQKEIKQHKQIRNAVGIDLGIKHFTSDSNGNYIDHPHFLEKTLKKLKKEQRRLSKKKKKSKNREKQRIKLAIIHEKINNQRDDFLHQLSRVYVDGCDFIAVEELNIGSIIRKSYNAKNIMDSSWSKFIHMLSYKAERAGKIIAKVNPKDTTQKCSSCGGKVEKSLAVRKHKCPHCGIVIDRDHNAAINILKSGLKRIKKPNKKQNLPQELRDFKPVEIGPLLPDEQVWSKNQEAPSFMEE